MITYKNKEYPTRTFTMTSEETGEVTYTIATESLSNAMGDEKEMFGTKAHNIDEQIHFYVDDCDINIPADELCSDYLAMYFEFIEEL